MPQSLEDQCRSLLSELQIGHPEDVTDVVPLTGGVASDIASVRVGQAMYCAKFALPKLKVTADWHAPVHRNMAEYAWLQVAADVVPESAVRLFGCSDRLHGFVMEYVTGSDIYLWKTAMLQERPLNGEAAAVGDMVGRIHAASTLPGFDASPFQNRDDFNALRIEPYLAFTAGVHEGVAEELNALAHMLYESSAVLVHGDVSPKNILIRRGRPIILDAECATLGDACFDPAFCLNHLVLKGIYSPVLRADLFGAVGEFWRAYEQHITWEDTKVLESRVCQLLPALMLARIDGKSPVEYLDDARRAQVRQLAELLIKDPVSTLGQFMRELETRQAELET